MVDLCLGRRLTRDAALAAPFLQGRIGFVATSLRPAATVAETDAYRATPQFAVSLGKLAVMSLCTFGLYELYWFYKQWDTLRRRERENLSPFWRTFFAPLWAFSLFPRIRQLTAKYGVPATWSGGGLALAFLIFGAASRLPARLWMVSLLSFLPLLVLQRAVNTLNATVAPGAERNNRYSGANVVVIVIGAILLALAIAGTFLPDTGPLPPTRQVAA